MANPTTATQGRQIQFAGSEQRRVKLIGGSTSYTYYPGEMIGVNVSGYHQKFDDTASLRFAGVVAESVRKIVDAGDSDGDNDLVISQPRFMTIKTSGGAITDIGHSVYAKYSDEAQKVPGTYGNFIGRISKYISATEYEVEPIYYLRPAFGYRGRKLLAATGTITLTNDDIGKLIVVTSSGAQTINLPALSTVDVGEGFLFFKGSGGSNTATLDGDGSETINGATTSATMTANYKYVEIIKNEVSSGTYEWSIIRSN